MKNALTVKEFILKHGAEKTAYKLINNRVERIFGLGLTHLPDTLQVADLIEELADILNDNPEDKEAIKNVLSGINIDFIESLIYG